MYWALHGKPDKGKKKADAPTAGTNVAVKHWILEGL